MIANNSKFIFKRIGLLLSLAAMLLTGCIPKTATDDLMEETKSECFPKAQQWFDNNMPEATVSDLRLYGNGYDCTRSVQGNYVLNGESFEFLYNCDTNEMLSDDGMSYANECAVEIVSKAAGLHDYIDVYVHNLSFAYTVTFLENRKNGWDSDGEAKTDLNKSEVGVSLGYLPIGIGDNEIKSMVTNRLTEDYIIDNLWMSFEYEDIDINSIVVNEDLFDKVPGLDSVRIYKKTGSDSNESIDYKNPN